MRKLVIAFGLGSLVFNIGLHMGMYIGRQDGFKTGKMYGFDLGHAYGVNHCNQDGDPGCRKRIAKAREVLNKPEIFSPPYLGSIERL
jgi:hypothetical protein